MSKLGSVGVESEKKFRRFLSAHRSDIAGLAIIVLVALCFLSPALKDGTSIGGFDLDTSRLSPIGRSLYASVHNLRMQDAVAQMVAWNTFDWRSIHSGQFPLWNSYSVLGMPEFSNFESSVLSLPDLVGYLFPLSVSFLVSIAAKLIIAGCGVYVFARSLRLQVVSSVIAGVTFMLSGALSQLATSPQADVFAWMGWLCAGGIWVYRSRGRWIPVVMLSLAVAFFFYGGFPEANLLVSLVLGCLGVVWIICARRTVAVVGIARIVFAWFVGAMLAAPLWLPGLNLISRSIRSNDTFYPLLSISELNVLLVPGYDGLPVGASTGNHFYETVSYLGVIAVILAFVALADRARRKLVVAFGITLVLGLIFCYQIVPNDLIGQFVSHLGPLSDIRFSRLRAPIAFLLSVLCAIGFQNLLDTPRRRQVRVCYAFGVGLVFAVFVHLYIEAITQRRPKHVTYSRLDSLIWPTVLLVAAAAFGLVVLLPKFSALLKRRWRIGAIAAIVGGQVAFLFFSGVGIGSYNEGLYVSNAPEKQLAHIVGTSLLGLDTAVPNTNRRGDRAGFFPEVNVGYEISEFAAHDPLIPSAYYKAWGGSANISPVGPGYFYPDIDSAALARQYGIRYVLAAPEVRETPPGMVQVTAIGNETLYRIPGATRFSFDARDATVLSSSQTANNSYQLMTQASKPTRLITRVTALPGWHLTSDGKSVALHPIDEVMLSATIPAGRQSLRLWYWPARLTMGIVLAIVGALLLFGLLAVDYGLSRWRPGMSAKLGPSSPS